jgi:hypothetical protein
MLKKLKEYKEIIAIIVFFIAGFIWLENQFPKKADLQRETGTLKTDLKSQIKSLDCLLEKYMTLTQLQIRGRNLEKEIMDFESEIQSRFRPDDDATGPLLSPAMKHELKRLEDDLAVKIKDLRQIKKDMENIDDELARNICGKGE